MRLKFIYIITILNYSITAQKINLDTLNNYSEFLNYGDKKLMKSKKNNLENSIFKSKIDIIGEVFKTNIDSLKISGNLDIIFLVDASSSVGESNFKSELKFVKKLLSDVTVDYNHTRVAIITFSSPNNVITNIDEISKPSITHNKCLLLNKQLSNITYSGGETYTLGAFERAKEVFATSRNDSKKVLFLITDGFSNGGDPIPLATELKKQHITIFTIGIQNGNYKELYEVSSQPGEYYSYLLDSFEEFEGLARRALHVDLKMGDYIPLGFDSPCNTLCEDENCCDRNALCSCGTTTGHYSCICQPGYYGSGLKNDCLPCIPGTYSEGPNLCLPCPDIHHTTTPPAFGIESCKCKLGYQATSNNQCKILKCPKVSTPEHGYLVKKRDCGNVLNSACGIRCEVGYSLVGDSIRLCQANATWSGSEPKCEVKTCSKLSVPKYGSMECWHEDLGITYDSSHVNLPVDTVCKFSCSKGKALVGSSQRNCLPLARWDGLKTSCKQIKCSKLPQIKYGKIEPSSCTVGRQDFGKKCTVICNKGFKIKGPSEKRCDGEHGTWDSKYEETTCVDEEPPRLECPKDINITSIPGNKFGYVTWQVPNITDNSGMGITVWMKPAIKNVTSFRFPIGITTVTYFAQDSFNNKAKCTFHVNVEDKEKPTIENCESPSTFLTPNKKGANVSWDEPNIYDNSQIIKIQKSHEFGFFKIGVTTVTYTATDISNNTAICKINITIEEAQCEVLPDPIYGHSDCNSEKDGMQCVITCQEGYAIPLSQIEYSNSSVSLTCNHSEPIWDTPEGIIAPDCAITQIANEVEQSGELSLIANETLCNSTKDLNEITNDIENILQNSICSGNCSINTETECNYEKSEEETNIIKREAQFEVVPHKNKSKKPRKRLNVKFQVRGKFVNGTLTNETMNATVFTFKKGYNVNVNFHKPKFLCPLGFVPRKNRCVQCPKGTFHDQTKNKCESCPLGYYNDKLGQNTCILCPKNFSTKKMHSKKIQDCKEQCGPGTFARRKLLKQSRYHSNTTVYRITLKPFCRSCNIGYYQPNYGQLHCLSCPKGYTTIKYGSNSIHHCVPTAHYVCSSTPNICNNGTCITISDYQFTCECSTNYIGTYCERLVTICDSQPCLNHGTCILSNAHSNGYICKCPNGFTGRYCEETEEQCNLNCLNNGVCVYVDNNEYMCKCPKGFSGVRCEQYTNYCYHNLCENNGTCIEDNNSFKCICSNGFFGRRCHILPCDYRPCSNGFICINIIKENTTRNSYKCICPEGYTGSNCTEKIDYCKNSSCLNNGACRSETTNYVCVCSKLFYGRNCEFKRETKYILNFPNYDTNNYVKLNGFKDNISEITVCMWMQTEDSFNYGTLVSYATRKYDNAFTLTDYTGLVIYVNNQHVVTDILLNDGYWHHLCVLWSSHNGNYEIFINGILQKNGTHLAPNSQIEGFGNTIIGQEQDIIGGRFSQSESFKGKMSFIDMWSKLLTEDEINSHLNDCSSIIYGNLYSWVDMLDNIRGNIQLINSIFCNNCSQPRPLYNGYIDIVDNKAFYSCYVGYKLSIESYINGRKCTKASTWEGTYEPYCGKIYCGYPGSIRNGYSIGNKYYYLDKINYECHHGYNMTGNNVLVCKEDGKWFPDKPECLGVQCSSFNKPNHSFINILSDINFEEYNENMNFDIGTQLEIICDNNTILNGEHILTCQENGTWDFQPPNCNLTIQPVQKLSCSLDLIPKEPENGYIDVDSLNAVGNGTSSSVEYKCRLGYKLIGENISTCIIDGYWTVPNISCQPIACTKLPKIKNMVLQHKELSNSTFVAGNMIVYDCIDGHRLSGKNAIRCLSNGRWTRMQGRCTRKTCSKPIVVDETTITGNSYLYEDQVTLTCPNGKQYTLKCNKDGVWEGHKDTSC